MPFKDCCLDHFPCKCMFKTDTTQKFPQFCKKLKVIWWALRLVGTQKLPFEPSKLLCFVRLIAWMNIVMQQTTPLDSSPGQFSIVVCIFLNLCTYYLHSRDEITQDDSMGRSQNTMAIFLHAEYVCLNIFGLEGGRGCCHSRQHHPHFILGVMYKTHFSFPVTL